jgi:hypothetical protein
MVSPGKTGPVKSIDMPARASIVPSKIPVWTPRPDAIDQTSIPWAMRPRNGERRAPSWSVCRKVVSHDSPVKSTRSASVTVRAADQTTCPTSNSSNHSPRRKGTGASTGASGASMRSG